MSHTLLRLPVGLLVLCLGILPGELLAPVPIHAEDWPAFRGSRGNGYSSETELPLTWSKTENIRWRVELPAPGNSSPIVIADRVYVTYATKRGQDRTLLCLDRNSGKELWQQTVNYPKDEPTHGTNPFCGSTPVADSERVIVWHSSAGLHCYDHSGKSLWSRDLGEFRHIWGYGASPILYQDRVILNCGPANETFLIALDKTTGKTLWRIDQPGGNSGEAADARDGKPVWTGSWSTPVIASIGGRDQIVISYPKQVQGHDPQTGAILWSVEGLGDLVYTSPMLGEEFGVALGGYHGPGIGFRLGGSGNVTETHRLWRQAQRNPQRIGSGVVIGKHLFLANANPATAQCLDIETGTERWQARMPTGEIWGSVVYAAGRLYATNPEGKTYVWAPNPDKFEQLAVNELGEQSNSTPAMSNGEIFLRTFQGVYCVSETMPSGQ